MHPGIQGCPRSIVNDLLPEALVAVRADRERAAQRFGDTVGVTILRSISEAGASGVGLQSYPC
jgi:hypothetical protein